MIFNRPNSGPLIVAVSYWRFGQRSKIHGPKSNVAALHLSRGGGERLPGNYTRHDNKLRFSAEEEKLSF